MIYAVTLLMLFGLCMAIARRSWLAGYRAAVRRILGDRDR